METQMGEAATGMAAICLWAKELRTIQDAQSELNARQKELGSRREALSKNIVDELENMGNDAGQTKGIILDGIGVLKLETKPHPRVLDLENFLKWAEENKVTTPSLTINPTTLAAWFKEEAEQNLPIPPIELMEVFWKTTAKVNKGG